MTSPYRAMCALLLEALEIQLDELRFNNRLCIRARALLAQPEQVAPTVMEIIELHTWMEDEWRANNDGEDLPMVDFACAVLAKWGHSTPQPLPSGYIDPEHKGEDLALLETFYRACLAEGGTVNEIELRGIRAVPATHSTPQPPADGELTVNLRMDLSSECLKRLCDGLAAAVIPNGGYRELTTDDDISGEFIGEQQVSVTWWLPEHGCDSLENTLDAIKGRLCAAVRDWLPTAVTATPQPPPQPEPAPVAVSERPWEPMIGVMRL
jgi:hypothetical protein